ncbi:hypothetical protein EVAR_98064_1 [Eumeta japonica]|uniref:Uncharacterized protein n=1 Tax=Eumeta variegata TaxID=151549 RepID=A0A4C1WD94_EUMVA|nr:hypothetical protein EVAR_98064_1 [Eumeta japonica]
MCASGTRGRCVGAASPAPRRRCDCTVASGGARRRRPPTASRLKGPRKQKSFAYKLLKRGLANLMSPTSTSGVAPPLPTAIITKIDQQL